MHRSVVNRFHRFIPYLLFLLVVVVGIYLAPSIGPAWDEPDNIYSGGQYMTFIQSGFKHSVLSSPWGTKYYFSDKIFAQDQTIARYPPVPNIVGAVFVVIGEAVGYVSTPLHIIIVFHLATVVFLGLLVVFVYRFGKLLGFPQWASTLAGLLTFLYPTLFGHGLSYLKDTAQVSFFTMAIYYLARGTLSGRQKYFLKAAICWGLGLASKFNAVYVPIIWGIWSVTWILTSKKKTGMIQRVLIGGVLFSLIGLIVTIASWPYLWTQTMAHTQEVVAYFTTVGQGYNVFWNGIMYQVGVGRSLWWYPWENLIFVTPILLLVCVIVGIVATFIGLWKRTSQGRIGLLLIIWMVLPLLRAILPSAAFYDGIRHFMEALPPLILLGVIGMVHMTSKRFRFLPYAIGIIILVQIFFIDIVYFPYSTGYLNALAPNPNIRFDRDIEALSVREAIAYLHKTYGAITVWVPIAGHLSWYYLTGGDMYVYNTSDANSIVLVNKSSHVSESVFTAAVKDTFDMVHMVRRGDTIFAWIYRKKNLQ